MNARGVPLTDFELFKADLQKKDGRTTHFDLMAGYLKDKDTLQNRVELIGKFNNEYTNFFFNLIDNGIIKDTLNNTEDVQLFDISMMNFINEIFRMNYFCTVSEMGVSQKSYRSDNDLFRKMSGKEFSTFINTNGRSFNTKYWKSDILKEVEDRIKETIIYSFESIIKLLDYFSSSSDSISFDTNEIECRYLLAEMIKKLAVDPQDIRAIPFRESLIRMALFEFILRFGIPTNPDEKNAFITWSRFVWKIDRNSDLKNYDEAVETLIGYRKIIERIQNYSSDSVIEAFSSFENNSEKVLGAPAEMQFEEEVIKAKLIKNDIRWKDIIIQSENYFSDFGQIWFLLDLSSEGKNIIFDIDKFKNAFELSKKIFDGSKHIANIDSTLFERALLVVSQNDEKDHLLSMGKYTTNTKRFVGKDFSAHISHQYNISSDNKEHDRYEITITLLRKMLFAPDTINIDEWLNTYINSGNSTINWKDVFIKYPLLNKSINGLVFKNGFEPEAWDLNGNKYTAVYTNKMKRTFSGELYSFLLASKLSDAGVEVYYHTNSQEEYLNNGFPNRFFTVAGIDVGYMHGEYYSRSGVTITKIGDEANAISSFSCITSK